MEIDGRRDIIRSKKGAHSKYIDQSPPVSF